MSITEAALETTVAGKEGNFTCLVFFFIDPVFPVKTWESLSGINNKCIEINGVVIVYNDLNWSK